MKAAGLPAGTRYHDLQRFHASALTAANINPKVIQARLGHASISETMDGTYGHLFPDSRDLGRGAVRPPSGMPWRNSGRTGAPSDHKHAGQSDGGGRAGL